MTDLVNDKGELKLSLRDQMRADFFSSEKNKPESRIIKFRGYDIEIRQPNLGAILAAQSGENSRSVAQTLIQYAFVPGTDEKIFDPEDEESLLRMPFGGDFVRVADALTELTSVNFPKPKSDSKDQESSS